MCQVSGITTPGPLHRYEIYAASDELQGQELPIIAINTSPLKSAYAEANIFAPSVTSLLTGSIPPRIMEASKRESTNQIPSQ
jgi:hypothetical protein